MNFNEKNLSSEKLLQILFVACDVEKSVTTDLHPGKVNVVPLWLKIAIDYWLGIPI